MSKKDQQLPEGSTFGQGDKHMLDELVGLFHRRHIRMDGEKSWHPSQVPMLIALVVLVFTSFLGIGQLIAVAVENPARIVDGSLFRQPVEPRDSVSRSVEELQTEAPQPASTTEAVAALAGSQQLGVIGCSNTHQHVMGYEEASNLSKMWPSSDLDIWGGSIAEWGNGSPHYWGSFDENLAKYGAQGVWIQLCIKAEDTSEDAPTQAQKDLLTSIINDVHERINNATIYVSPINGFSNNDCQVTGIYGYSNGVDLSEWAVAEGLAVRGPDTGPFGGSDLRNDKCHLSDAGIAAAGKQMVAYFDNGEVVQTPPDASPEPTPDPDPTPIPLPAEPTNGVPDVAFTISATQVKVGQTVTFTDETTDDGEILRWRWKFGDNSGSNSPDARHRYRQSGTYTVQLYVVDNQGNRSFAEQTIVVTK